MKTTLVCSLLLAAVLLQVTIAADDFFLGGSFLMAMDHEDDDNLSHVASFVGYMPDEDRYDDVAHGGVLASYEGTNGVIYPDKILSTPKGLFAIGDFQFVDGSYTQSVAEFKSDEDDWDSVNYGIWTAPTGNDFGGSVDYVAGTEDFTVFGGSFSLVESYMIYATENNMTATVQNLVTVDDDGDWRPLDGWATEEGRNSVDDLAAHPDSAVLFIIESGTPATLFRWENGTLEALDNTDNYVPNSLVAASEGDLYALTIVASAGGAGGALYDIDLVWFAAGEGNAQYVQLISGTACPTQGAYPIMAAYGTGVILAVPDQNCENFSFETLYEAAPAHNITDLSLDFVEKLVAGSNGTLWALADNQVFFNADPSQSAFIAVDFTSKGINSYDIHDITFNADDEELYVYGTDTDLWENFFFAVEMDQAAYGALEIDIKDKSDGNFAVSGTVNAMASVDVGKGDVDIYVGGYFNYVGTSDDQDDAQNFAVLRGEDGGVWQGLEVQQPISSLASYNGAIFISYAICVDTAGQSLPIAIYDPEADNIAQFAVTPANLGPGDACVNALVVEEDMLFVGGNFVVNLPKSPETEVNGAIAYNVSSQTWMTLNVPGSIEAPQGVGAYDINTFSIIEENGVTYVLIGGFFTFTANGNTYESLALYNINSQVWEPMSALVAGASISQAIYKDSSNTVIAGSNLINAASTGKAQGIMNYDLATDTFTDIGTLEASTEAVLLYTTFNTTYCYAGGDFITGMLVLNLNQTGDVWTDAGSNVYGGASGEKFFSGYTDALMYAAGGQGQEGENGYYSSVDSFQSSHGGMHWFWIVFLCILASVIVIGAVVVISAVGFMAFQKKRRQNYENV